MCRKYICAIVAALLAVAAAAGCAGETAKKPAETSAGEATGGSEETAAVYKADIPDGLSYDGVVFNICTFPDSSAGVYWIDVDFCATEENGETINDATFRRKRIAEDILNIKIVNIPANNSAGDMIRSSVSAQDGAFDIGFIDTRAASNLSQTGVLLDFNEIKTLDMSAPWWDQNCIEDLTIDGALYMLTGDIEIMYKKTLAINLFNKAMFTDYNLGDPYQYVEEKAWTIEKFAALCKAVSEDLNGDGKMDGNDRFGLLFQSDLISIGLIGAGVEFVGFDGDGMPTLTFYNDYTVSAFEKYTSLLYDKNSCTNAHLNGLDHANMFLNNRGLFFSTEFHAIEPLRQMDTDFGILPMPLYDEKQSEYYHSINPHVASMLVIPRDCPDLERVGYVLDVLGAESKNILTPAYYEVYLKSKGARDDESEAIIDLVLATVRYDLGYMYNWGNIGSFMLDMVKVYNTDLASSYSRIEKSAQRQLDKAIEKYQELKMQY
ncbi:MAG: extracellular solute-binding protein [Eubacteriales bacterium]|jgi:ABC-type glycerol-3-phosphate transport system substrate-binding protein|nr:extracellular solute-binding protein [Clostridiales bacterium]